MNFGDSEKENRCLGREMKLGKERKEEKGRESSSKQKKGKGGLKRPKTGLHVKAGIGWKRTDITQRRKRRESR